MQARWSCRCVRGRRQRLNGMPLWLRPVRVSGVLAGVNHIDIALMFSYLLSRCQHVLVSGCHVPIFLFSAIAACQPLYLSNHAMCRCQLHLGTPPPIHSRLFMSPALKIKAGRFSSSVVFLLQCSCFLPTVSLSLSMSVHPLKFGTDRGFDSIRRGDYLAIDA